MDIKKLFLVVIIWFIVGCLSGLGIMKHYWNTKILPDMYKALQDCQKSKLDIIN